MPRAYVRDEGDGRKAEVNETLTIGRTRDCGLAINDSAASRRHMEIELRDGLRYAWKDLGSTNGTIVNGKRMLAGELRDGDSIQIGDTVLSFHVDLSEDSSASKVDSRLFQETILDGAGNEQAAESHAKAAELLEAVYSVVNEIASNDEPLSLMNRILATLLDAISGERGAIFLNETGCELLPDPACHKVARIRGDEEAAEAAGIRISQTVMQRVLSEGRSVLYQDTDMDSDIDASESIVALDLRSIICVPLRARSRILGTVYIDSKEQGRVFNQDDLLLAAAVANSAGLALENARMRLDMIEKARIDQEIELAWSIQQGFLVKSWPLDEPRYSVFGETRPAKTVGGDFYDFVVLGSARVGLLIGDVSGKGVPAALTMAQLLAHFRVLTRDLDSPAEILQRLNRDLYESSQRGLFATVCYVTVDLESGAFRVANAGHHPLLHLSEGAADEQADASGPPLGVTLDFDITEYTGSIASGESILLYTDASLWLRTTTAP